MKLLLPLLIAAALASGCGEIQQTADSVRGAADSASRAADCAKIGADLASLQLERVNDPQAVDAAAKDLREKVQGIDDKQVRDAAGRLATRAQEYASAVARGDTAKAQAAARRVEIAARETAQRCGVPVEAFLG